MNLKVLQDYLDYKELTKYRSEFIILLFLLSKNKHLVEMNLLVNEVSYAFTTLCIKKGILYKISPLHFQYRGYYKF